MTLKVLLGTLPLHRSIAARLRKRKLHLLAEQLEALHLIDGLLRALDGVEDDERLALGLEVRLGHDVDYGAVFREQLAQRLDELRRLDALFEVARVYTRGGGAEVSLLVGEAGYVSDVQ